MKNLYLIPTTPNDETSKGIWIKETRDWCNIYITSDLDINENDYIITSDGRLVQVSYLLSKDVEGGSKVTLTTDQDLVKDGVPPIGDDFLEWFIKNPSCEEVDQRLVWNEKKLTSIYKIIIPKEGFNKTHYLDELPNTDKEVLVKMWECATPKLEPKQETLEEAAERILLGADLDLSDYDKRHLLKAMIDIAKWKAEISYSDDEVIDLITKYIERNLDPSTHGIIGNVKDFIKEFKK